MVLYGLLLYVVCGTVVYLVCESSSGYSIIIGDM